MQPRHSYPIGLAIAHLLAAPAPAQAQEPGAPPPPDVPAPESGAPSPAEPAASAVAPPGDAPAGPKVIQSETPFPTVFTEKGLKDVKPVLTEPAPDPKRTTGMLPTHVDFGAEGDMYSEVHERHDEPFTKRWNYTIRGFLRAPMRVGLGPRNDGTVGSELHSPPRIVGADRYEWTSTGLAAAPDTSLFVTIENLRVSGTVIIQAGALWDVGFKNVKTMGGVSQAYVTLKFPDFFDDAGGLVWTVGAFSNRYGNAGPEQKSSGYYETQLFGRTHVLGEAFTADLRLSGGIELLLEHGFGAKLEVIPWLSPNREPGPPRAPWLPEQGPSPLGSTFLHHAHAQLLLGDSLSLGAHYLYEWSPNDFFVATPADPGPAKDASLTVVGGDLHYDDETNGHGYVGFSHASADNVLPLADGLELIHSRYGLDFVNNYFDPVSDEYFEPRPDTLEPLVPIQDSGSVNTLLFQYMLPVSALLGWEKEGPRLSLAAFGMYNSIDSEVLEQTRLKLGAEAVYQFSPHLSAGFRFDRVMPDGSNSEAGHVAFSPRIALSSNWIHREYVLLSYTRYVLGDAAFPTRTYPYPQLTEADPNLIVLSAAVSF